MEKWILNLAQVSTPGPRDTKNTDGGREMRGRNRENVPIKSLERAVYSLLCTAVWCTNVQYFLPASPTTEHLRVRGLSSGK